MWNFIKKNKWWVSGLFSLIIIASVLGVQFDIVPKGRSFIVGQGAVVLRIGTAEASGTVDYVCDGTDDDIQFQGALDALPATGGEIQILSGNYDVGATVTRAIDNVTIRGVGRGTYITYNGANAIFTAGGNNWTFINLRTDAGSLNMGATTGWAWENVTINATYYAYRTDDATSSSSWNIPTGRSSTYVVAASDAPAGVKAQADVVCDGTADNVEIQAAIDTNNNVVLSEGTFNIAVQINLDNAYQTLQGNGLSTILKPITNFNDDVLDLQQNYITIRDLQIDGNKANQSTSGNGITNSGTARYDRLINILLKDCKTNGLYSTVCPADMELYQITATGCTVGLYFYGYNGGYLLDGIYVHECTTGIKIDTSWLNMGNFRVTGCDEDGILITSNRTTGTGATSWICLVNGDVDGNKYNNIHLLAPDGKESIVGVTLSSIVMMDAGLTHAGTYSDIRIEAAGSKNITDVHMISCEMWEHADTLYGLHITGDWHVLYITVDSCRLESASITSSVYLQGLRISKTDPYYSENTGDSTGTGVQQTIAHGLGTTPNNVVLSEYTTGGALAYQSAPADATNIYITATLNKTYIWKASVTK